MLDGFVAEKEKYDQWVADGAFTPEEVELATHYGSLDEVVADMKQAEVGKMRFSVVTAEDENWGDETRKVRIVGGGVPSWKYVKGTKVSEHKAALETMAYANIESQPNHEIDPETGNHCLVIDGTRIRISKGGLFHGADRRLQNIGNAIANIGDVLNNSVSVPNTSGEYSYRIAEADFGRPEFVLVTLKNIDGNDEVVDLKRVYSVNVKAGNAAQSTTSTSVPRLTEDSIANLKAAWQRLFKPGIDAHNIAKRDAEYLDAVKRGDMETADAADDPAARAYADAVRRGDANERTTRLAPNGKRSNLSNALYHLVRTRRFKDWFGDWENAELRRFIETHSVASASGDEYNGVSIEEVEDSVAKVFEDAGGSVVNGSLGKVNLTRNGIHDTIMKGVGRKKLAIFNSIPSIVRDGRVVKSDDNWKGRGYSTSVLVAPVTIGGDKHLAVVVVRKYGNKDNNFYLHEVELLENFKNRTGGLRSGLLKNEQVGPSSGLLDSIAQIIYGSQQDASKVVDENGEPMVVYHGTDADFTVFDKNKGRSTMDIQGMFFSPWKLEASGYGGKVGAYYLSIKNLAPEEMSYKALNKFKGQNEAGKKAREWLESLGYDGAIFGTEEYIAFNPEQIKSATDNRGTFDPANPDIRFSISQLYTGSAADYEKPSLLKVGTGEGSQVYGWRLYASNVRGVAEGYASGTHERPKELGSEENKKILKKLIDEGLISAYRLPSGAYQYSKIVETEYGKMREPITAGKLASEFLSRADIDGIKYPVDSYGKTVKDGDTAGWNYVSFRDDNIRVDRKWVDGVQRFSIGTLPDGRKVAVIDRDSEIAKINLNDPDSLHDYLVGKVGDKLFNGFVIGSEAPDEYVYSKDAEGNNKRVRKAKAKLATGLDDAANVSGTATAEPAVHKKREGGVYYRRGFVFAVPSGFGGGFRAYTADMISYMENGVEQFYDVVNIKDEPSASADLTQMSARIAANGTSRIPAKGGGSTPRIMPNGAGSVKGGAQFSISPLTNENVLKFHLARDIMENGGRLPDAKRVARLARSYGYAGDLAPMLDAAKAEADNQVKVLRYIASNPDVEKALAKVGLDMKYEKAIIRGREAAIQFSREVSEAGEKVRASIDRAVRAVHGEDYEQMVAREGIDLNAILRAMRPAESEGGESAAQGDAEGEKSNAHATPEERAATLERARKAVENGAKLIAEAQKRIAEKKDGDEEKKPRKPSAGKDGGEDGETDANPDDIAVGNELAEAYRKAIADAGFTLDDTAAVVQLVKAITEKYILDNPATVSDLDPSDVWASPIARAMFAGNVASFAQDVAAAYSPSHARVRVAKKSQMLEDRGVNTIAKIEEVAEDIFRDLNRDIIRQSRKELIRDIKRIVTNPARHFAENQLNQDRKIDADTAKFCKFVKWAISVPASEVEATAKELEDFLNGYATAKGEDVVDSTRYRDFAEAQLKLSLLDAYGNLGDRMPAELTEIRDHLAQRVDEAKFSAMCFSEKWEQTRNAAVEAAHRAIVGNPKDKGVMPEDAGWLWSVVGIFETKWRQMTRFCRDENVRGESIAAMSRVEELIQRANDAQFNYIQRQRAAFLDLVKNTYGDEGKAAQALNADVDESLWAQLDRGDQHTAWTVGRLLQMYVSCVQSDYADNCAKYGRGADYVAFLEQTINALDPRHMEFVRGMRQLYLEQGDALSEVLERTTGVPLLTPNRNYMPVKMFRDKSVGRAAEARGYSPFAPSLTPRVKNGLDFDQTADIIEVFTGRIEDAGRTVGWADTGSLVIGICQSDRVLNAIRRAHGKKVMGQWNDYILDVVAGPARHGDGDEHWVAKFLMRLAARTWLAINPASWAKQLGSVPCLALSLDGKLKDVGGSISFWALHPFEAAKVAKELADTSAFRARYSTAISQEMRYATSSKGAFANWWQRRVMDPAMSGVTKFDEIGVYLLAGVYRQRRIQLEQDGMDAHEASETASAWLMHIVDKTAQTSRSLNLTQLQRNGGAWNLILQFKSAPAQQTQFELTAYQEALADPGNAAKWKKAAAVAVINHLIVPTFNTVIEGLMTMLTGWGIPDEEKRKRLVAIWVANVISGSLGSIAFLGTMWEWGAKSIANASVLGEKPNLYAQKMQPIPAMSLLEHLVNSGNKAVRAFGELTDGDIAEGAVDMAEAIGGVVPPFSWVSRKGAQTIRSIMDE